MKLSRIAFLFGSLQHASKANCKNLRGDRKVDNLFERNNPPIWTNDKLETRLPAALQKKLDKFSPEKQAKIRAKFAEMNLSLDADYVDIDDQGEILFEHPAPPGEFPIQDGGTEDQQYPVATSFEPSGVPIYHSKPGATYTLYLDFDGHAWSGHAWASGASIDALPYSLDADFDTYSDIELSDIGNSWAIVAEDFAPFDIDVTTEAPEVIDNDVGHALMTNSVDRNGTTIYGCNCGGAAYLNKFGSGRNNYLHYSPALVFNKGLVALSEALSHEFGHNLGLYHDGKASEASDYYAGHGTGETDWAPIMGVGYFANTVQWSKGEYTGATQTQDDLAIIAARLGYSADDHTADTPLSVTGTDGFGEGLIKRSTDEDSWTFQASGSIKVTVSTRTGRYGNLDAGFRLVNKDTQVTLDTVQPEGLRSATWTGDVNNAAYAVVVFSSGNGANADAGYTNYGSLGQYEVTVEGVLPPSPPSSSPSSEPTMRSAEPSQGPSSEPSNGPSSSPSMSSASPSAVSAAPTTGPTLSPSTQPSSSPSSVPTMRSAEPSQGPTSEPSVGPSSSPSASSSPPSAVSAAPTTSPTLSPSTQPSSSPSNKPSLRSPAPTSDPETQTSLMCPHANEDFRCPGQQKNGDPAYAYICHTNSTDGVEMNKCILRTRLARHIERHGDSCGACESIEQLTCPYDNEDFRCPQRNKNGDPAYAYLCHTRQSSGEQIDRCILRTELALHGDNHPEDYCGKCESSAP